MTAAGERWLTSAEACARLGVKRATLYTYVSRGAIRCAGAGHTRRYLFEDVERVAARSEARRGHAAVAVGALRWGEPVLDTAITSVGHDGLSYRGRSVEALARARTPFEAVADLLWESPAGEPWPDAPIDAPRLALPVIERYVDLAVSMGRARHEGAVTEEEERADARRLLRAMASVTGDATGASSGRVAEVLAASLGVGAAQAWRLDVALVVMADHELNASSFAARIAASAGADLFGCVSAALQVLKGTLHGGVCDRIEALLAALPREGMRAALQRRVDAGGDAPGFGHRLYPKGDPRVGPLLEAVDEGASPRVAAARAYREAGVAVTGQAPTVDVGLVSLAAALELPSGAATALFALGRTAGWVAHVLEQRRAGVLLRPRARYVGPKA